VRDIDFCVAPNPAVHELTGPAPRTLFLVVLSTDGSSGKVFVLLPSLYSMDDPKGKTFMKTC